MPAITPAQRVARHRAKALAAGARRIELLLTPEEARLLALIRERLRAASDRAAIVAALEAAAGGE